MRKNITMVMLSLGLLGISSCNDNFLDQTATTDLNEKVVFADSAYAAGFLTQIYHDIGFDTEINRFGNGGLQVACDEAEFAESSSISTGMSFATGTINPLTVTNDAWNTCYTDIRRCNKFLKLIDGTPMDESTKTQYKAECKFLRAWYYYILLRHYGGIPLIGDTCYAATDKVKSTRDTYADCVNYISNTCNELLKMNVLRPRNSGRSNGRISEAVCQSLLSRLYLDAASPLHNGSGFGTDSTKALLGYPNYDKELWNYSLQASRSVMTSSGDYRLFKADYDDQNKVDDVGWGFYAVQQAADFSDVTNAAGNTYPYGSYQELILEKKDVESVKYLQMLCPPSCGGNRSGGFAYADMADAFPMADGKPIGESKYTYDPLNPAKDRDSRFKNTIVYDNSKMFSGSEGLKHVVYIRIGDGSTQDAVHSGTPTGYYTRKGLCRNASGNWWIAPPSSRPLIRFSEILLNYAEAANEYYGPNYTEMLGTKEIGPYECLKMIRDRAGIEPGTDGMYGLKVNMTQEEMREAIRNERRIELAFEGFRFFDVRRWMIADQIDSKPMHGLEITASGSTLSSREFVVRTHVFRKAMYFWPIPYSETVKTPELLQNPYYE